MSAPSRGRAFSLPIPFDFESLDQIADLSSRIGNEAAIYAIRLWQHRQLIGPAVTGGNAVGVVEHLAGWSGKRGELAFALTASGIIRDSERGIFIIDPFDLCSAEWNYFYSREQAVPSPSARRRRAGDIGQREWVAAKRLSGGFVEVYERDGYACRYCGAGERLSLDHVIPKSRGGAHDAGNLVVACARCNSQKGARTPVEAGMALTPPLAERTCS